MTGLRVTGGRLARRRFKVPAKGVRPTPDRARESLFSAFSSLFEGAHVLDLFAGSGALGIEALSRGAERAVFVERDGATQSVLKENLESLGLRGAAEVVRADAHAALARLTPVSIDVAFVDPPYADPLEDRLWTGLAAALAPDGRVVVERAKRTEFTCPPRFEVVWERRFGDALIRVLALADPT